MPKKCVGVELIAIFNPGVSASKRTEKEKGSRGVPGRETREVREDEHEAEQLEDLHDQRHVPAGGHPLLHPDARPDPYRNAVFKI